MTVTRKDVERDCAKWLPEHSNPSQIAELVWRILTSEQREEMLNTVGSSLPEQEQKLLQSIARLVDYYDSK